jgi:hypothetical protein
VAIYQPRQRRWPLALAAALLGGAAGFGLGWAVRGEPVVDPVAAISEVRAGLASVAGTLEIVEIEYAEAVEDGQVVSEPEYGGARDALARARGRYRGLAPAHRSMDPESASEAGMLFDQLEGQIEDRAAPDDVTATVTQLTDVLDG